MTNFNYNYLAFYLSGYIPICAYLIIHIINISNKIILEKEYNPKNRKAPMFPTFFIKNPYNYSNLSQIHNVFLERTTLLKEDEIKIKGLLIDRTFYLLENLKKNQLNNSVLEQGKKEFNKQEILKSFSKDFSESKVLNNSMEISPLRRESIQVLTSHNVDKLNIEKSNTIVINTMKRSTISPMKKNISIDFQHFSDLYSTPQKNAKLFEVLQVLVLCHFSKSKTEKTTNENIFVHMNPEDKAILEFASMHDASFESYMSSPKHNLKCFNIKIQGMMETFPILGFNEFTEARNRFSIVLHHIQKDNAVLLMRGNNHSLLDILEMSEQEKIYLKSYVDGMKNFGYRYIIYAKKELDINAASIYIQRYNICKTSLTIEHNELNKFYTEVETGSRLVTVLFIKDKLVAGCFL